MFVGFDEQRCIVDSIVVDNQELAHHALVLVAEEVAVVDVRVLLLHIVREFDGQDDP